MINEMDVTQLKTLRKEMTRFMLSYRFAIEEIETKVKILQEEFRLVHDYNPIEHVSSRLKSPESLMKKIAKKGIEPDIGTIRETIRDIAGIRITCSFTEDIYRVSDMLQAQKDIEIVDIKDYIREPKPNGYRSLHLIIRIPIFMSDRTEHVFAEIQIRTIAMDFWASLEHKIYYKYNKAVPDFIRTELKEAAEQAASLDGKMERLNKEINILKEQDTHEENASPAALIQWASRLNILT